MAPIPRANALKLASAAYDLGAEALRGELSQNEAGRWTVGYIDVESWLSRHAGYEIVLTVAAIDRDSAPAYRRVCRTCGNEFEGPTCPHCEAVRQRLRGK